MSQLYFAYPIFQNEAVFAQTRRKACSMPPYYTERVDVISPILSRERTLAREIAGLDVSAMTCPTLPRKANDAAAKSFRYEGYDIIN